MALTQISEWLAERTATQTHPPGTVVYNLFITVVTLGVTTRYSNRPNRNSPKTQRSWYIYHPSETDIDKRFGWVTKDVEAELDTIVLHHPELCRIATLFDIIMVTEPEEN